jgi:AcrR family transcriptional regulator
MPEPVKKRSYTSPMRKAQAEATRARVIAAAARLFLEGGYGLTSTAAIARAAQTSEASLFAMFGSKADLLVAVISDQVGRSKDFPVRDQPAWRTLATEQDKTPAIEAFARITRRAHERSWRLLTVASAAAQDDSGVAEALNRGAGRRHADCEWLLHHVIAVPDTDLGDTTDGVWTLISVENYRHLVVERSWSPDKYESWLVTMLTRAVTKRDPG